MYFSVKVRAGARKEVVELAQKHRIKIAVKEPAERNLANNRVKKLLSEHFKIPLGKVRLISGHTSPSKIFDIDLPT